MERQARRHRTGRPAALLTLDGGPGDNVVLDGFAANAVTSATAVGAKWLKAHARSVKGKTLLKVDGKKRKLPRAKLVQLKRSVSAS